MIITFHGCGHHRSGLELKEEVQLFSILHSWRGEVWCDISDGPVSLVSPVQDETSGHQDHQDNSSQQTRQSTTCIFNISAIVREVFNFPRQQKWTSLLLSPFFCTILN